MTGGHGHVTPRPDGVKARCGGPGICPKCSEEQARFVLEAEKSTKESMTPADEAGLDEACARMELKFHIKHLEAENVTLRARVKRMQPVVDAAVDHVTSLLDNAISRYVSLEKAVQEYQARQKREADKP